MTPGETKFFEWMLLILGAGLTFSGWRTIRKRHALAEGHEYEGKAAERLGWLWIFIGILLVLAAIFPIGILKSFGRLFMESAS